MNTARKTLGALVLGAMLATPAFAQIEWFPDTGMSYVRSRSQASGASGVDERCAYASLNEPKSCPWCRQYDRCERLPLAPGTGASSRNRTRVDSVKPPLLDQTVQAIHGHGVEFGPKSFRLDARVAALYENRGKGTFSNRGIGEAAGEVYLRVPEGVMLDYVANLRFQWNPRTGGGMVQLVGVPNTGADLSAGFGFHAHHLAGGSPATVHHRGRLMPGVYRLIWSMGVDSVSHETTQAMAILAELLFEPTVWPQCTPEGMTPVLGLGPPWAVNSTSIPRETLLPLPIGPGRHDRATRTDSGSRLVDINLKGIGDVYQTLTRAQLEDVGLPANGCVVAGHGNPDTVLYNNSIPVPPEQLAKLINRDCWPDEPVVLLSCNTGLGKDAGLTPYAQRLSRALRDSGRQNVTVYAPTSYVAVVSTRDIALPVDPFIVLIGALDSQAFDLGYLWFKDWPARPNAIADTNPRFIPYVAQ